ncbi:hypothetical protein IWZ00DRAFT_567952 [Phyllosticta capitalensis]
MARSGWKEGTMLEKAVHELLLAHLTSLNHVGRRLRLQWESATNAITLLVVGVGNFARTNLIRAAAQELLVRTSSSFSQNMSEPVLSSPTKNLNMDDHRIGFVCLDVAAAPTGRDDVAPHKKDHDNSVPNILVEDTSEDSHLPTSEQQGSMNKVSIYLARDKRSKGYVRLAIEPIDRRISAQLVEQIATAIKDHDILTAEQKAQLGKIVVQDFTSESASVGFLGRSEKPLCVFKIRFNITRP